MRSFVGLVVTALVVNACSDSTGPQPLSYEGRSTVILQVSSNPNP